MSAVVFAWIGSDTNLDLPGVVALASVFVLSMALGRALPGWGFTAPVCLAVLWLVVVLVGTPPTSPGDEAPTARALAIVFLVLGTLGALAGVLVGAISAVWSWASRTNES